MSYSKKQELSINELLDYVTPQVQTASKTGVKKGFVIYSPNLQSVHPNIGTHTLKSKALLQEGNTISDALCLLVGAYLSADDNSYKNMLLDIIFFIHQNADAFSDVQYSIEE